MKPRDSGVSRRENEKTPKHTNEKPVETRDVYIRVNIHDY
jgi:hypothetical protein